MFGYFSAVSTTNVQPDKTRRYRRISTRPLEKEDDIQNIQIFKTYKYSKHSKRFSFFSLFLEPRRCGRPKAGQSEPGMSVTVAGEDGLRRIVRSARRSRHCADSRKLLTGLADWILILAGRKNAEIA
jgi:hypothetical protein